MYVQRRHFEKIKAFFERNVIWKVTKFVIILILTYVRVYNGGFYHKKETSSVRNESAEKNWKYNTHRRALKKMWNMGVYGRRPSRRSRKSWNNIVVLILLHSGFSVGNIKKSVKNRKKWKRFLWEGLMNKALNETLTLIEINRSRLRK